MSTKPNTRNGSGANTPNLMTDLAGVYQYGVLIRLDWGVTVFRRLIPQRYPASTGRSWSRSGATVTVTHTAHGFLAGQSVAIWHSTDTAALPNATYTVATVPTADTYTVTGVAAGATSGTCTSAAALGSWSRSGTTVTVTETGHGRSVGDTVIVWDSTSPPALPNATYTVATVPTANTFTLTGVNTGATSGTCSPYQTYDLSSNATATAGLDLPVNQIDDHWNLALGVDEQNRVHIAGNTHASNQNYIRSAAGNITSWTAPTYSGLPWASSGANSFTYNTYARMTDGRLLWFFDQAESVTVSRGRDYLAYYLPTGAGTTWLKLVDNTAGDASGELAQTNADNPQGITADRVYIQGVCVEPRAAGDRIHVAGIWRTEDELANSQQQPFYAYTDSVGVGTSTAWKNAYGEAITIPFLWANRTTQRFTITSAPGRSEVMSTGLAIDKDGYPHVILKNGDGGTPPEGQLTDANGTMSTYVRCYFDGTDWRVANLVSIGSSNGPCIHRIRGDLYTITSTSALDRVRIRGNAGGPSAPNFLIGGDVDSTVFTATSSESFDPTPDPVMVMRGQFDLLIPDGDTPRVFSFGNHAKRKT